MTCNIDKGLLINGTHISEKHPLTFHCWIHILIDSITFSKSHANVFYDTIIAVLYYFFSQSAIFLINRLGIQAGSTPYANKSRTCISDHHHFLIITSHWCIHYNHWHTSTHPWNTTQGKWTLPLKPWTCHILITVSYRPSFFPIDLCCVHEQIFTLRKPKKCWGGEGEQVINILVNRESKTINLVDWQSI